MDEVRERVSIEGMSCGHCVMAVEKALQGIAGVVVDDVEIGTADVRYDGTNETYERIERAIHDAGYEPRAHRPL